MSKVPKPVKQSEEGAETKAGSDGRQAAIRAGVLKALGNPTELLRVAVLPLWGDKFRVNVWIDGSKGVAIPNSYFVTAAEDGTILRAEPPIERWA
jgi:hypothetical protein